MLLRPNAIKNQGYRVDGHVQGNRHSRAPWNGECNDLLVAPKSSAYVSVRPSSLPSPRVRWRPSTARPLASRHVFLLPTLYPLSWRTDSTATPRRHAGTRLDAYRRVPKSATSDGDKAKGPALSEVFGGILGSK